MSVVPLSWLCPAQYVVGQDTSSDSASNTGSHPAHARCAPYALAGIAGLVELEVNARYYLHIAALPNRHNGVRYGFQTVYLGSLGLNRNLYAIQGLIHLLHGGCLEEHVECAMLEA